MLRATPASLPRSCKAPIGTSIRGVQSNVSYQSDDSSLSETAQPDVWREDESNRHIGHIGLPNRQTPLEVPFGLCCRHMAFADSANSLPLLRCSFCDPSDAGGEFWPVKSWFEDCGWLGVCPSRLQSGPSNRSKPLLLDYHWNSCSPDTRSARRAGTSGDPWSTIFGPSTAEYCGSCLRVRIGRTFEGWTGVTRRDANSLSTTRRNP
jgi:hypothetical protein